MFALLNPRFREMCEDGPPVKALNFLQTQVSSVVDHSNAKETETFRALLTHLLAPPSLSASSSYSRSTAPSRPISRPSSSGSSGSSTLQHEDTREGSTRPRKRSRGEKDYQQDREKSAREREVVSTPESEKSEDGSGVWTSELLPDTNCITDGASVYLSGGVQRLREMRDPLEDLITPSSAAADGGSSDSTGVTAADAVKEGKEKLTGARYAQRTEVFERILKFVVESEKQPEESLLDLVESDRGWSESVGVGVGRGVGL